MFPGEVDSVKAVSDVLTEIRYQVVIAPGSVEPKPIRAPIATLLVAKAVPDPVKAVPTVDTVPVVSFFTSILKSRTV